MKDYLPYAAGVLAGLLVAFLMSSLLALTEHRSSCFSHCCRPSVALSLNAFAVAGPTILEGSMARLKEIVIDCDIPSRVARFWAEALDGYDMMPYDDEELARLCRSRIDTRD